MDKEQLFNVIGKMYIDLLNAQIVIEALQKKTQESEKK
jgi:hypothetical protein